MIDLNGPWWNQLPSALAFEVDNIPEDLKPFYEGEAYNFLIDIHINGGRSLPEAMRSPSMLLMIGYYAYTHRTKCTALN